MQIALFKNLRFDFTAAFGPPAPTDVEYVRVSAWVEVEFPMLSEDEIQADVAGKAAKIAADFDDRKRVALERIGVRP